MKKIVAVVLVLVLVLGLAACGSSTPNADRVKKDLTTFLETLGAPEGFEITKVKILDTVEEADTLELTCEVTVKESKDSEASTEELTVAYAKNSDGKYQFLMAM